MKSCFGLLQNVEILNLTAATGQASVPVGTILDTFFLAVRLAAISAKTQEIVTGKKSLVSFKEHEFFLEGKEMQ